jgi:hypothetical protein
VSRAAREIGDLQELCLRRALSGFWETRRVARSRCWERLGATSDAQSGSLGQIGAVWAASQSTRFMLKRILARPIFVVARAMPMVRMNNPIGPF